MAGYTFVRVAVAGSSVPLTVAESMSILGQKLSSETAPILRLAPSLSATKALTNCCSLVLGSCEAL